MVEQCRFCERVRLRDEWFECGLIHFKPHEIRQTVCADCAEHEPDELRQSQQPVPACRRPSAGLERTSSEAREPCTSAERLTPAHIK